MNVLLTVGNGMMGDDGAGVLLAQMLRDGELAGAGLDVTAVEPLPADNELWDCPNIIITPHNSPTSEQTRGNVMAIIKENLRRYLAGQPLNNLVDKEAGY